MSSVANASGSRRTTEALTCYCVIETGYGTAQSIGSPLGWLACACTVLALLDPRLLLPIVVQSALCRWELGRQALLL